MSAATVAIKRPLSGAERAEQAVRDAKRDVEYERLRAIEDGRAKLAAEKAPPVADLDAEFLTRAQLGELPKPEWLIDGVLSRNAYAILRGRDGTYKTFVALDWALSLATGKRWQDHATVTAKVLYVAGEGAHGITARVDAWESAWQRKIDPDQFVLRKSAVNLFNGGPALDHLLDRITGGGFGLVVIDTLRRASGRADGNSSDMGVVVDNVERIKRAMSATGGTVLVLTHTDKGDNDSRGFSGIEDDADVVWHSKRADAASGLDLENTKMKDAQDGAVIKLATVKILDSLVLENRRDGDDADPEFDTDRQILTALDEMFSTTGASTTLLIDVIGMNKSTFHKAKNRLERAGRIELVSKNGGTLVRLAAGVSVHGSGVDEATVSTGGVDGLVHA